MPETRQKTVLEIGVDDREVEGLGRSVERALSPRAVEAFTRSVQRAETTMIRFSKSSEKAAAMRVTQQEAIFSSERRTVAMEQRQQERRRRRGIGAMGVAAGVFMGHQASQAVSRMMGAPGAMAGGAGTSAALAGAIPLVGPAVQGIIQGILQIQQSFVQREVAAARAYGVTGVGGGAMGAWRGTAQMFGVGPTEAPGMLGGFAQQTGMRGPGLGRAATSLLEYQQLLGFGQLGGVLGAAGVAGGEVEDPRALMEEAVSSGVVSGFRIGRMDRFFAQFSGWLESVRTEGIPMDPSASLAFVTAISRIGPAFKGEAGLRAAQGLYQGLRQAPMRGGMAGMVALRAAGFRPEQRARGFVEAMTRLEDPSQMLANMQGLLAQPGLRGMDPAALTLMLKDIFGDALSWTEARDFALKGRIEAVPLMREGPELLEERRGQARRRGVFAVPAREAGLEAERARVGGRVSEAAYAVREQDLRMAAAYAPAMAGWIAKGVVALKEFLDAVTEIPERLDQAREELTARAAAAAAALTPDISYEIGSRIAETLGLLTPEEAERVRDPAARARGAALQRRRAAEMGVPTYERYLETPGRGEALPGEGGRPRMTPAEYESFRQRSIRSREESLRRGGPANAAPVAPPGPVSALDAPSLIRHAGETLLAAADAWDQINESQTGRPVS